MPPRFTGTYQARPVAELPYPLEPGCLYLVESANTGEPWCVGYLCPCGCGDPYTLPLVGTNSRPYWDLTVDAEGRPTLTPSIRHLDGCQSHYFIRNGQVQWA